MATYSIPEDFIEGFINIVKMSDGDFTSLVSLINELKIAEPLVDVLEKGKNIFTNTSPKDLEKIVQSIVSIVDIFENASKNIDAFTSDFSKSYLLSKKGATETESLQLKERLSVLLRNFENLSTTVKAQDLLTENKKNFRSSRIITDIRLLFNNDASLTGKHAVVVHNLKIEYYSEDRRSKDFFVALDLSDLKKMKSVIDRAIEKDKLIKETQQNFSFIDFNNASSTNTTSGQ